ncbi:MAG: MBL fold metallo-hydrolase [Clostridia bacterium]|nr:MBL fold metallo-hydrolase [Clostridia bacterium]
MKRHSLFIKVLIMAMLCALLGACAVNNGSGTPDGSSKTDEQADPTPVAPPEPHDVELYQLAPEDQSLMMCYVIRTPNDKIVVIDGGIAGYGKDAPPYLPAAIRAILGLQQDGYFEVEAWFLSHGHNDHIGELAKMLEGYTASSNYKVNNIYFNFPEFGVEWKSSVGAADYDLEEVEQLKRGMDNYYAICGFSGIKGADIPAEQYSKPADAEYGYYYNLINGAVITPESIENVLNIEVDGVNFRVLQTWAKSNANVNSTSTVIRMTYGEHSVLFLGDSYTDNASKLLRLWPMEEIASEYVQMGHHGQHGPDKGFYRKIGAADSIRLWPTPKWVWEVYKATNNIATDETRGWVGLPKDFNEFAEQGLDKTGRDYISGLAGAYPSDPTKVSSWNAEVLGAQRVAVFAYLGDAA